MGKMNFSKFQMSIFNEVENGNTNLAINAVAGSGKTTTIVECCKRLRLNQFDVIRMVSLSLKRLLATTIGLRSTTASTWTSSRATICCR